MKTLLRLAGLAVLLVAAIPILFFLWPAVDAANDQVTVYPLFKSSETGAWYPANRTVYKVFAATQTVIHWMPGISEVPDRLYKCSVRDRLNWRCEYSDGSATLTMEDGTFSEKSSKEGHSLGPETRYTDRLTWWRLSFR